MEYAYNLLIDSPSELAPSFCKEHHLHVLNFTFAEKDAQNGLSGTDDMFETMSPHDFYEAMRAGAMPFTTQPSQHTYEVLFKELLSDGKPLLYLCFDSAISGAYEGAMTVLERMQREEGKDSASKLHIVDTKEASTPLTLLCYEAALKRDAGASLEELEAWATHAHEYLYTYFMVDDLQTLYRGGRIPKTAATVGSALNIKPLLTIKLDGSLGVMGFARGRKKGLKKLADNYLELHDPAHPIVGIGNADCEQDAEKLIDQLKQATNGELDVYRSHIGPVVGSHVGPGMISCCFWGSRHEGA